MSIVIAVCTNNYKLMMADSRICSFDSNDLTNLQICSEKIRKYRVMNSNVCIGVAGDLAGVSFVNNLVKEKQLNVDDYANIIISLKGNLANCYLNTSFILVGIDRNNKNSIITLSQKDNFEIDKVTPNNGERAYRAAMPFMPYDLRDKFICNIELVVGKGVSDVDIEKGLKKILIDMSKVDISIDDNIRMWSSK